MTHLGNYIVHTSPCFVQFAPLSSISQLHLVYCPRREQNARGREKKEPTRAGDPVIVAAWEQSDNGKSFQAALQDQGYRLAQGNNRLVVVDRWGKAHNPARHLISAPASSAPASPTSTPLASPKPPPCSSRPKSKPGRNTSIPGPTLAGRKFLSSGKFVVFLRETVRPGA
jgi:hypothetical protein